MYSYISSGSFIARHPYMTTCELYNLPSAIAICSSEVSSVQKRWRGSRQMLELMIACSRAVLCMQILLVSGQSCEGPCREIFPKGLILCPKQILAYPIQSVIIALYMQAVLSLQITTFLSMHTQSTLLCLGLCTALSDFLTAVTKLGRLANVITRTTLFPRGESSTQTCLQHVRELSAATMSRMPRKHSYAGMHAPLSGQSGYRALFGFARLSLAIVTRSSRPTGGVISIRLLSLSTTGTTSLAKGSRTVFLPPSASSGLKTSSGASATLRTSYVPTKERSIRRAGKKVPFQNQTRKMHKAL